MVIIRSEDDPIAMEGQTNTSAVTSPKLLDQVRQVMRLRHYSIHTERSYLDWIKRYVHFHRMKRREELAGGEAKIEAFPTYLAVKAMVTPATQNQAMNALVFLCNSKAPGVIGSPGRFHDDDLHSHSPAGRARGSQSFG